MKRIHMNVFSFIELAIKLEKELRISLALFGEQRFRIVNVKDRLISAADPLGHRLYQQRAL